MKYLFILSPNNSGSTLLHNLIATSPNVAHLNYQEGQIVGWHGPLPSKKGAGRVFTEIEDLLSDSTQYDWGKIKKNWNAAWNKNNNGSLIRLEKSPPNICRGSILEQEFENSYFIIMPRNPYAQIQSITKYLQGVNLKRIAKHALRCLQICKNLTSLKNSIFFKYEDLCDDSRHISSDIINFMPELKYLDVDKKFKIHDGEKSKIVNMNENHIDKLQPYQLDIINSVLENDKETLSYWGYDYEF